MRLPDLKHLFEVLTARSFLTVLMLFVAAVGSVRADNTPEYTLQCEGIERVMSCGSSSAGFSNKVD